MTLDEDLEKATEVLKKGGVILYPTDTVWGIGCDATDPKAVEKVFAIKRRVDSKALIVLLPNANLLSRYVDDVPDIAYELIDVAVRPLTIIFDRARNIATNATASDGSVGIRITQEHVSNSLCRRLRRPLVSTSANISGEKSPAIFQQISAEIIGAVDYVMEARRSDNRLSSPSSIIKISEGGVFTIIRK